MGRVCVAGCDVLSAIASRPFSGLKCVKIVIKRFCIDGFVIIGLECYGN